LKARALDYLSRREYSRVELMRKLAPFVAEQREAAAQAKADAAAEASADFDTDGDANSSGAVPFLSESHRTRQVRRSTFASRGASRLHHVVPDEDDPLPSLLDQLEREGWLSDSRFTDSVVHRKAMRFGTSRIVGELKQHAIDPDRLAEVRDTLRETEAARAKAVWQRKFGSLPDSPQAKAKQARFLASRGFSIDVIRRLLNASDEELSE
jgi:regulatory protein